MAAGIGSTIISARPLAEYVAMFALTEADLAGSVLDCPGGAASFTAELCDAGGNAIAADPAYDMPVTDLAHKAVEEAERGNSYVSSNAERYSWSHFPDVASHHAARLGTARLFASDVVAHPGRYIAAALPHLPFEDRSFDLVLCAHLLFTYADRLDDDFHFQALLELARLARCEARVFPLLEHNGCADDQRISRLCAQLAERDVECEIRPVDYEFQRNGNKMLVLRH